MESVQMSFFVLAIAAAHAVPPIVGAVLGRSMQGLIIGIVIGCIIALLGGSLKFIIPDLIGVGLGAWLGYAIIGKDITSG